MAFKIVDNLTPYNFTDKNDTSRIKYIVIHYFGSLGTAKAVANYFASAYRGASAHYSLDEGEIIYRSVEDGDIAWHCGADSYVHAYCRNSNSIGIEVRPYKVDTSRASTASDRDWYFNEATIDRLVEFTVFLMKKYNIPLSNVIRHYDVTGKWCPRPMMGTDTNTVYKTTGDYQWALFKKRLESALKGEDDDMTQDKFNEMMNVWVTEQAKKDPSEWSKEAREFCEQNGIINGDGNGNMMYKKFVTREELAAVIYRAVTVVVDLIKKAFSK